MKNINEALNEVVNMYTANTLTYEINQLIPDNLWVINVHNQNAPGSLLQIEVIDDEGIAKCSVLQKVNVGRKSMCKFMDRFLENL